MKSKFLIQTFKKRHTFQTRINDLIMKLNLKKNINYCDIINKQIIPNVNSLFLKCQRLQFTLNQELFQNVTFCLINNIHSQISVT